MGPSVRVGDFLTAELHNMRAAIEKLTHHDVVLHNSAPH